VELALKAATYDALSPDGLNIVLPLQASAGSYTLRAVVQEAIEGKMSASSMPIEMK
jgi:hypothetical protein